MAKKILRDPNLSFMATRKHKITLENKKSEKFLATNEDGTIMHGALSDALERFEKDKDNIFEVEL